jgi:hypothetical protein
MSERRTDRWLAPEIDAVVELDRATDRGGGVDIGP